uniref:restriction endonuclease subunit S n=1 Tax=Spirosoma sp. TaxID=1899569 RepID=UPI003B3BBB0C
YTESGRIFISAQNVNPFKYKPEIHRYVSEEAYLNYIKGRTPEYGDVLVARVGAGIGEAAVINKHLNFAFYVSLGLIKPIKDALNSYFLEILFNSIYGVTYSKGNIASSGTSAGNFNLEKIRKFPIPLPPLAEQQAIVEAVKQAMEKLGQLRDELTHQRTQAGELLKALLHRAFQVEEVEDLDVATSVEA